jgi:7-cyano-7-deazaguanine synthase in queuosine biosynthesis
MRLVCGPRGFEVPGVGRAPRVILYGQAQGPDQGSAGEAVQTEVLRRGLNPDARAWDLLSIALSVVAADFACVRDSSPDGWTREFELEIAVADADFWNREAGRFEAALAFLTTDRWRLRFHGHGVTPRQTRTVVMPDDDSVLLLSGGLDSLVGAIDRVAAGWKPIAISQVVRGDGAKQSAFARRLGIHHLPLNHNARVPGNEENSQRARSLIFIAFGVLAATTLQRYRDEESIPLFVCENGFIAINPPLTGARLGSLSTRTAHPEFLQRLQCVLDEAGLRVRIQNPYSPKTKGEMLIECAAQDVLRAEAAHATSCGRFQRFNYRHCGRCVPCQVRRAAFVRWGVNDTTDYVYTQLGRPDAEHAGFDDVRSVAMALAAVGDNGLDTWLGGALRSPVIDNRAELRQMVERGLGELKALHDALGVR